MQVVRSGKFPFRGKHWGYHWLMAGRGWQSVPEFITKVHLHVTIKIKANKEAFHLKRRYLDIASTVHNGIFIVKKFQAVVLPSCQILRFLFSASHAANKVSSGVRIHS